jgi:hypothetical protein
MGQKQNKQMQGTPARATPSTDPRFLPAATQLAIDEEIEHSFFERALSLVSDLAWARYRNRPHGPILAAQEFTAQYTGLLAWAFAEYIGFVAKAAVNHGVRVPWHKAESAGFIFLNRFVTSRYHHPWTGDFLRGQKWIGEQHAIAAYQKLHEVAPWFDDRIVTPEMWERVFYGEMRSGAWRERAIENGKSKAELITRTAVPENRRPGKVSHAIADAPPWSELQKKKAIKRAEAAAYLRCSVRTIRDYIRRGKLDATELGWVICNGKLMGLLRRALGDAYR